MAFTVPYVSRSRYHQTEGVNDSWTFRANGIGKTNETFPYVIVNEWVSASIAQYLQLPIPPFGLFKNRGRRTLMFGSVSFEGDTVPNDVRPAELWRECPRICTGILVFDILVANSDRHRGNIKVDDPGRPSDVYMFDHDRTLLHITKGEAGKRLSELRDRLGISAGSVSGGNRHCLLDVIDTAEHMPGWLDRVDQMPLTFIEDVCRRVERMGATKNELKKVVSFLEHRRHELPSIINEHRDTFPNISQWPIL